MKGPGVLALAKWFIRQQNMPFGPVIERAASHIGHSLMHHALGDWTTKAAAHFIVERGGDGVGLVAVGTALPGSPRTDPSERNYRRY